MYKYYFTSGFLYHPSSEQILLEKVTENNQTELVLFRGKSSKGNSHKKVFQLAVEKSLQITIPLSSIKEVYDYIHNTLEKRFIFYVEFKDEIPVSQNTKNSGWFQLTKLSKYPMSEQTQHDIIVGQRVIRARSNPASSIGQRQ